MSWTPESYGERIAEVYDRQHADLDPSAAVEVLAELARGGRVLELGIGTGRVALPLAGRGVEVHGLDASPAMLERLRAKPGGEALPVTVGDFTEIPVEGPFDLVYVVFNTFFELLSQEAQVRCFQNVAARLAPGGVFLLEAFVPDPARFTEGQTVRAREVGLGTVTLEVSRHDRASQRVDSQHVVLDGHGVHLYPVRIRYAWPSELDLMARLAGLELRHRWGGWGKEPFDAASTVHVSVYEKPPE